MEDGPGFFIVCKKLRLIIQRNPTVLDTGAENDLGTGFAKALLDSINKVIQISRRRENDLHDFRIISGYAVALHHIGNALYIGVEFILLPWFQLDLNKSPYVKADFFDVN